MIEVVKKYFTIKMTFRYYMTVAIITFAWNGFFESSMASYLNSMPVIKAVWMNFWISVMWPIYWGADLFVGELIVGRELYDAD